MGCGLAVHCLYYAKLPVALGSLRILAEGILDFVKDFSILHIMGWSCGFCLSVSFMVDYIYLFSYVDTLLHHLILWVIFLIDSSILLASILLSISFNVYLIYWPIILILCWIFFWFCFQGNSGIVNIIWECSFIFCSNLRRIDVSSSLKIW